MKEIGGYFELELQRGEHYHKNAIKLNTARNCFEYVLKSRGYNKIYIPYYTCDVLLQPLKRLGVEYQFYHIDENLEPAEIPCLSKNEAFLYTNYYGLKRKCIDNLANIYKKQLIVDNAQVFYEKPIEGIDTFYSARKFFGVCDGAYLYTDKVLDDDFEQDISYLKMQYLMQRIDKGAESAYHLFRKNEDCLDDMPIKKMSKLTERILESIDYANIGKIRRKNYLYLQEYLHENNKLRIELSDDAIPMVYPYMTDDVSLKNKMIENKIFVATYWPNVLRWSNTNSIEYDMAEKIVHIPIDQRYNIEDMLFIVDKIKC